MRSCAPYGISPCTQHENVSRILAHFLLSTPYLSPICLAIPPTVSIATVLFAVHISTTLTNKPIDNSAPRLPCTWAVSFEMIKSMPPFSFMISSKPPAIMLIIISSPIPRMPVPILPNQLYKSYVPFIIPIIPVRAMPITSTAITFMPKTAAISTIR